MDNCCSPKIKTKNAFDKNEKEFKMELKSGVSENAKRGFLCKIPESLCGTSGAEKFEDSKRDEKMSSNLQIEKLNDCIKNYSSGTRKITNAKLQSKASQNIQKKRKSQKEINLKSKKVCDMKEQNRKTFPVKAKQVKEEKKNIFVGEKCDTSNTIFEIDIPLIGKTSLIQSTDEPLHKRYDLAIKMNQARFRHDQKEGYQIPGISYEQWRKQQIERTEEEKNADEAKKLCQDLQMAYCITRISIRILKLLEKEKIDEESLAKSFFNFMSCPVSPKSLLYVPHFVHAIMFCRGFKCLSRRLQSLADECFQRCHAMFPIPLGYNFETVYTSQVRKTLPVTYATMDNIPLEYEDFSSESESENLK